MLLLPSYQFALMNQRKRFHIGDLLPSLEILILHYEQLAAKNPKNKEFCNLLIKNIRKKFRYEFNSQVYAVAALLNISKLPHWHKR